MQKRNFSSVRPYRKITVKQLNGLNRQSHKAIQPSKPQQNAYVERYNRIVRHEWLDMKEFETIEE